MTLQFDPGAYASIFEAAQNRKLQQQKMLQDSLGQIPQAMLQYQQNTMEQKRQDLMNQLTQGRIKQQNMEMSPLVPPAASGTPTSPATGSSMPPMSSMTPQNGPGMPGVGQFASAGTPDTGEGLSAESPVVQAWKGLPVNHPFGAQSPQGGQSSGPTPMFGSPSAGGSSQPQNDPESPYKKILMDPTESPIRQKMASEALGRITEEEKTPYEIPTIKAGLAGKQAETTKNLAEAKKNEAEAQFMGSMGGKQGQMSLKLQDNFNKENKDTIDELKSAQTADGLIDAAKQNPVAYNALPLKLAKMLTGSSRININEIKAMGGSQAILDRAQQVATQMGRGTITNDNYQFMKGLTKVLVDSNKNELRNAGMRKAMQVSQLNKQDPQMNYQTIVGEPYGKETFGAMPSGQDQGMGGGMPQVGQTFNGAKVLRVRQVR